MEWIKFDENNMPEPKKLVWVKRVHNDVHLGYREDKPYSIDKELHHDCFWHGNAMPLGTKLKIDYTWYPNNSFCDKTVTHYAELIPPTD